MQTSVSPAEYRLRIPPSQRFVMLQIDWAAYRQITQALGERRFHVAYDGWNLELKTASHHHARLSRMLTRCVWTLTEELLLPIRSCGGMAWEREDLQIAVAPDASFYIAHEASVRGKHDIDLVLDPPPDLALEIDFDRSSQWRIPLHAALGVPEIWCFDGESVRFLNLTANGEYVAVERSRYFPFPAPTDILNVLQRWGQTDDNTLVRSFRQWIRQQLPGAGQ
jgi:Uma2 family endonuclease